MEFKAFEPGIEVNGRTVFSIVAGFKSFKNLASKILLDSGIGVPDDHGMVVIEPEAWYSQEAWLAAFERIAQEADAVLYTIGLEIPANAQFPPWVKDIDSAIQSVDIAYHMNHRKQGQVMFDPNTKTMLDGIGHYGYQRLETKNRIVSECRNPYPCDFDLGILTTMAQRFEPDAWVRHDDSKPCRRKGADSCTYLIEW